MLNVLELLQAVYQVTVLLVLNFLGKGILNLDHDNQEHANKLKNTLIFNAFVFCQVSLSAISGFFQYRISLFKPFRNSTSVVELVQNKLMPSTGQLYALLDFYSKIILSLLRFGY